MIRNNYIFLVWKGVNQRLAATSGFRFYCAQTSQQQEELELNEKLVKVSIIGLPNSGKSTFINSMLQHRVCPTSSKVHTTTKFSTAITIKNSSQVVLFDTPGLVTKHEMKKHKLDSEFISSCRHSIQNSNLIGVLHDISNHWTRNELHPIILDLLKEFNKKESFLVLNKIDKMRSKRALLDVVKNLTCNNISLSRRFRGSPRKQAPEPSEKFDEKETGWPNFMNVFMVSALTGDGVEEVLNFIESNSKSQPWEYKNNEFTNRKPEELIEDFVRARLLDYLPQEIPYLLKCQLEYYNKENNKIYASVIVTCPNDRVERLLCGSSNGKLKQITDRVTSDLIESFRAPISLTISTVSLKKKDY